MSEPETIRPESVTLPDGAVIVPGDGGTGGVTLGYGGTPATPLFPHRVLAHGRDLKDAATNLLLWLEQRRGQGRAGRALVAEVYANNIRRA